MHTHNLFCLLCEMALVLATTEGEDGLQGVFATDLIMNHLFN